MVVKGDGGQQGLPGRIFAERRSLRRNLALMHCADGAKLMEDCWSE